MQHSAETNQIPSTEPVSKELIDALDRAVHQYDRMIQEQTLLLDRLRKPTDTGQIPQPRSDIVIRRAA